MINQMYLERTKNKNIIREFSEYATGRGKEIGYENVFDYSLGNPSVPAPKSFTDAVIKMYKKDDPMKIHGYSPTLGLPDVRETIAQSLKKRFSINYEAAHIFPVSGAAGAIAHAVRAVTKPGDTVLTFAPFFPEYVPYIEDAGVNLLVVPAQLPDFQINFDALSKLLDENVQAVIINSPNNPSGAVYSEETLRELSKILSEAQDRFSHEIFLISDEPYREIVFDGKKCPYPASYYFNTLTCYSFSKSLSLPGERIGYIAVNPGALHAKDLTVMFGQISRGIGHNCPSSTMQRGIAAVIEETADLTVYEKNMNILYDALIGMGFEVQRPGGTFYIFPKCLEDDAMSFCKKALKYDLILVPSDNFGVTGYFRMAYCIDTDKVERSLPVLKNFVEKEYGQA